MMPPADTGKMKDARVRVDITLIYGNGKEKGLQQLWKDVPMDKVSVVKENAPGACIDAIASLFGAHEETDPSE